MQTGATARISKALPIGRGKAQSRTRHFLNLKSSKRSSHSGRHLAGVWLMQDFQISTEAADSHIESLEGAAVASIMTAFVGMPGAAVSAVRDILAATAVENRLTRTH